MRIVQLSLTDFLLVKDSGISKLEIDFTENVQLIIGSNGSGKSSCLRQLSTTPSSRSLFGKKGFKSLTIEKDGTLYRLDSEYEKPSSPHAFYEGDNPENLNIGRTTEGQKDLIVEHLGITPFIDDLIMNRPIFPKWTPSKRKEFLMEHNPDKIGFVFQQAKLIASKIKACKTNLVRLTSRKMILEQELMSDEALEDLKTEKEQISQSLTYFQEHLMHIEVGMKMMKEFGVDLSLYDFRAIKKTLQKARYKMSALGYIERDDTLRFRIRDGLIGELASLNHQIDTIETGIISQSEELAELESQYREIAPDGDLREIEETINRLERDRDRLSTTQPTFILERKELEQYYHELDELRNQLIIFETCDIPLLSTKKRTKRERLIEQAKYRHSNYRMKLIDLHNEHQDLSKRHTIHLSDIPKDPCSRNACPLYAHFIEGYEYTESKRQSILKKMEVLERKLGRIEFYLKVAIAYFQNSQIYTDRINWLVGLAQTNPILHGVLRSLDILTTLKTNPNRISGRLKEAYDHIDQWLKFKMVINDLETAYALKNRCMGSQSHDTVKLVVSIEHLKHSLSALRAVIQDTLNRRTRIQRHLDDIGIYEETKQTVLTIQQHHLAYQELLADKHEHEKLTFLKRAIEHLRGETFLRMSEVERLIRAQGSLRNRYQEEVVNEINRIEKELRDQEQIEKALIIIPKESIVTFVNAIFEQANRLIESVWTIPFKIELLKLEDPLTYEFQVSGDNQSVREMSECSDGQFEILSLAINLALRIYLGHLDLPICLDESGRTLDDKHKHHLLMLLNRLLEDKIISQLFLVSHMAVMHEGFSAFETLVIRDDNIMIPSVYNQHCKIS